MDQGADGEARRRRDPRRVDRQPRHRPAHAGRRLAARGPRLAALRERSARHGPVPVRGRRGSADHQRRQADRHHRAGRLDLRLGPVVRDDPRWPRRCRAARRDAGLGHRRSRQLGGARRQGHGHRRRDGPGVGLPPRGRADEPRHQGRRAQAGRRVQLSVDRARRGVARDHRAGRARPDARRLRAGRAGRRRQLRRAAAADRRAGPPRRPGRAAPAPRGCATHHGRCGRAAAAPASSAMAASTTSGRRSCTM